MIKWHRGSIGLLLLACGGEVDLGSASGWANTRGTAASSAAHSDNETNAPVAQTLYDGRNTVQAIAVDETTIAALIAESNNGGVRLQICKFEDCQRTVQTLDSSPAGVDTAGRLEGRHPLLISHGEVYWVNYSKPSPPTISACSTAGCPEGPRALASVDGMNAFAADADYVYWFDNTRGIRMLMARCARAGCDTPESLPLPNSWTQIMAIRVGFENRLVIDEVHQFLFLSGSRGIIRAPTDFSTAPEILHEDPSNLDGLAVVGDYVYFARSTLPGAILRCPIWGCDSGPEQVVAAPRWPSRLVADGRAVFWMNRTEANITSSGSAGSDGDSDAAQISATGLDGTGGGKTLVATYRSDTFHSNCAGPVINSHHLYWCEATGAAGSPITLNIRTLPR